jgi:FkbM family methyltransferase
VTLAANPRLDRIDAPPERPSVLERVRLSRAGIRNWLRVGILSRIARLALLGFVPRRLGRAINDLNVTVHPRSSPALRVRLSDLGAIFDLFVVRDYDYREIPWQRIQTVVDCGANVGAFTAWAVGKGATRALAVEPSAGNFRILQDTAARLGDGVAVRQAAVAGVPGRLRFFDALHGTNSSVLPWRVGWDRDIREYEVDAITLEEVLEASGFDPVDLLKLDVEGAEQAIFESLGARALDRVQCLVIECHPSLGTDVDMVVDRLRAAGMHVASEPREPSPMLVAWRDYGGGVGVEASRPPSR